MSQKKGLLLVTMEPQAGFEDEFNDWYDTEHMPQRSTIAGFATAQRFTSLTGWPRCLALYDLSSPDVLEGDAYQAISGPRSTPWSQRILAHVVGYNRTIAEQVYPGDVIIGNPQQILCLVFARLSRITVAQESTVVEWLCRCFDQQPGLTQLRLFKALRQHEGEMLALAEFHTPTSAPDLALERFDGSNLHVDCTNTYTPYQRYSGRSGVA